MTAMAAVTPQPVDCWRLLDGPPAGHGAESLAGHLDRLGSRPTGGAWLLDVLDDGGLRGRGGAAFPAGRKWRSVSEAAGDGASAVVVNAAEGEPLSLKDRTLLGTRPHVLLDGAALAAETLGTRTAYICINRAFRTGRRAVETAIRERRRARVRECRFKVITAPDRYVAGESSAIVNLVNGGLAKPTASPPSPHEVGVDGKPTLVQNCETIAHVALIARGGADWFRAAGTDAAPGTILVTLSGAVRHPGVLEVSMGSRIADAIACAGGSTEPVQALLLGGYFGGWVRAADAARLHLDNAELKAFGASIGCGVIALLPQRGCGLVETSHILRFLALESAGQCGPCVYGLAAISQAFDRLAKGTSQPNELDHLHRWAGQVAGRGACHHPDGALRLLNSALSVFAFDVQRHLMGSPCPGATRKPALPLPPQPGQDWR